MVIEISEKAPDFCLPDKDNNNICLNDFRGKWVILYFYPKDNTKGCTLEAVDFTENLKDFETMNAVILGVSPDSPKSHANFAEKHQLTITLLSDPDHVVLEQYGVWQLKKMYGKEYCGVTRSTFVIDPDGIIVYVWKRIKVKNHVLTVKETLQTLQKGG
jgi:peroxiredoxin Q/BCP